VPRYLLRRRWVEAHETRTRNARRRFRRKTPWKTVDKFESAEVAIAAIPPVAGLYEYGVFHRGRRVVWP